MRDPTEREILEVMESLLGFYSKELKRSDDPEDKLTLRQVRLEAEKACRAFLSVAATPPTTKQVDDAVNDALDALAKAFGNDWTPEQGEAMDRLRDVVLAFVRNDTANNGPAASREQRSGSAADGHGEAQRDPRAIPSTGVVKAGSIPAGSALSETAQPPVGTDATGSHLVTRDSQPPAREAVLVRIQDAWDRESLHDLAAIARELLSIRADGGSTNGEYICKCGIRVVPHRCQIGEEF